VPVDVLTQGLVEGGAAVDGMPPCYVERTLDPEEVCGVTEGWCDRGAREREDMGESRESDSCSAHRSERVVSLDTLAKS
jgi:hypothetical protein